MKKNNHQPPELKLGEIQGVILRGYKHHPYSKYIFLQIEDAERARAWLSRVIADVTTSESWRDRTHKPRHGLNIAFTYAGLQRLGYEDEKGTFSREFKEGMPEENRARVLGDTGESAPDNWELGGMHGPLSKDNLHILLMLYASHYVALEEQAQVQRQQIAETGGLQELYEQGCFINADNQEPFGFRDGLSQPAVEGYGKRKAAADTEGTAAPPGEAPIRAGEFILGYLNAYEQLPITPTVPIARDPRNILPFVPPDPDQPGQPVSDDVKDFGQNGSYMVFRKLQQDVAGFWQFMNRQGGSFEGAQKLAAKFMGRWPSGTPLVLCPEKDDPAVAADASRLNAFMFHEEDPHGYKCPIGSHIRRSNPRDSMEPNPEESVIVSNRHRVIRRGRPYGVPEDAKVCKDRVPCGIIFIAINSSIKRQFEFVQQTWVDDQKFDGLYDNKDSVTGDNDDMTVMVIQAQPVRKRIRNVPRFVQVRGGGYFFLPSITALKYLAAGM
ncbi:MAG TPA: peroxidase [Blastocatellia bacterium]|nr:peroxidase [Blastocatellia bacterium]